MSSFKNVSSLSGNRNPDLTKHVNYMSGMILGVDDFTQEFAYLAGRDRWLARDTLGFGTVSGLKVQIDKDAAKGVRVTVMPGVALSPRGQLVCVPTAQCAFLNEWLAANVEELRKKLRPVPVSPPITSPPVSPPPVTSPPLADEIDLFLVLCYRDCPVDEVPIPGEPCRNEEDLMVPSRIRDDFSLELRFDAPDQTEEEKLREFSAWLKQIKIVDTGDSTITADFVEAVRSAWLKVTSPPAPVPPPNGLQINAGDVGEYLRLAFRIWVTELRNVLSGRKTGCSAEMTGGKSLEDCVLLGQLHVPLTPVSPGWKVSETEDVSVGEEKRPFLLHLRMIQEWLSANFARAGAGGGGTGTADHGSLDGLRDDDHQQYLLNDGTGKMLGNLDLGEKKIINLLPGTARGQAVEFQQAIKRNDNAAGDLTGKYPSPTIGKLQGKSLEVSPSEGHVLTFRGDKWVSELPAPSTGGAGVTKHSELSGLDADDHKNYLLNDGTGAMKGNLNLGGKQITSLAAGSADDHAVNFKQAIKLNDNAAGDLTGKYPAPTIANLQGKPMKVNNPQPGDIMVFNGQQWITQGAESFIILPFASISRVRRLFYEVWFNLDSPKNVPQINAQGVREADGLKVFSESGSPDLGVITVVKISDIARNVIEVELKSEERFMRFQFNLKKIPVSANQTVAEFAAKTRVKYMSFDTNRDEFATVFVTIPRTQ